MDPTIKRHYYCFSFRHADQVCMREGSAYIGYLEKDMITLQRVKDAKIGADMPLNSVVISICYLGYMTPDEFKA